MPIEDISSFTEEEAREFFKECDSYNENDFVTIRNESEHIAITYQSNRLSSKDGEPKNSIWELPLEGGHTFVNFHISKETRERIYGLLHIREEHRGKGLGRSYVAAMEKVCSELGTQKVRTNNHRNPGFWERIGYVLVDGEYEKELGE